jgi:Zn-dependent protease
MPIGGMAEFDAIPRQPGREFLITIAGPAVNFAIFGLLALVVDSSAGRGMGELPASLAQFAWLLQWWNFYMGLFNLVPVFPMDGGRILRALLATRLPYVRATFWAATVAKVLAAIAISVAFFYSEYLLMALFMFIFLAGEGEYRAVVRRDREEAYWRAMAARAVSAGGLHVEPPLLDPWRDPGDGGPKNDLRFGGDI